VFLFGGQFRIFRLKEVIHHRGQRGHRGKTKSNHQQRPDDGLSWIYLAIC
jgi:hypothetical protein